MSLLRLQVQLTGEPRWHSQLAFLLMVNDQRQEARAHFAAALEKDASNVPIYLTLSDLDRSLGDMDGAIENAQRYQERRPTEMGASIKLGDLLRDTGDLEGAEVRYAEAQLLDSDAVDPLIMLHIIAARRGDDAAARRYLAEAFDIARTPSQIAGVHLAAGAYEGRLGRIDAAVTQLRAAEPYMAEAQAPFVVAITVHTAIAAQYLEREDLVAAQAVYDEAQALLPQPPLNQLLEAIAAIIAAVDGRFEAARSHVAGFEAVLEQMGLGYLTFQAPMLRAEIRYREGHYADAARHLEDALAMIDQSFVAGQLYASFVPRLMADLAGLQVLAGQLDAAESTLERGFRLDPFLPHLWFARARLQQARGQDQLAQASLGQVLAIWSDADPEHTTYRLALELAESLPQGGP